MIIGEWTHVRNILMGKQILSKRTPANKKRGRTYLLVWNAVTVLCGQLDCDDGHL